MTRTWKRAVLRLLLMVVLLLLIGPFRACASLTPPGRPADIGRQPAGFSDVYRYTDGIEVRVSDAWAGRRLGVSVLELTVVLCNGSEHTFAAGMSGELGYGSYHVPAPRYRTPPGPDDSGSMQLIASGEYSHPYRMTFVIPPRSTDDVVLDLAIDAGTHDPAVFVGDVSR